MENNMVIMKIMRNWNMWSGGSLMWLSFWLPHTLGLTASSLAPSAMVPPLHVERSSSEPLHPPRNCYSQYKQRLWFNVNQSQSLFVRSIAAWLPPPSPKENLNGFLYKILFYRILWRAEDFKEWFLWDFSDFYEKT